MKKLFIAVFVMLIGLAFTAPSFAVEHEFGGYWRVRMFTQKNFDGNENDFGTAQDDLSRADTRTRLFYTATINDNLKLVNAFEMDAVWGDDDRAGTRNYGRIGADGVDVQVKHTYADFNLGAVNAKVGTQGTVIHRGFLFDDDFSGAIVSGAGVTAKYIKFEEDATDNSNDDVAGYVLSYTADLDTVKLTPTVAYFDGTGDTSAFAPDLLNDFGITEIDMQVWTIGLDVDATFGNTSVWGTLIYAGGDIEADLLGTSVDADIEGWLVAAGANAKLTDMVSVHGQAFYASGDDDDDDDIEEFITLPGQSYYWSEIMGLGIFDMGAEVSNNAPGGDISNVIAANLGVTFAPMEKLSISADLWYAEVAEELAPGLDEELGFEVDLKVTYELVDGLNLDVVGAYLFAGDSTTEDLPDDEDPWEVGTRLSLSF